MTFCVYVSWLFCHLFVEQLQLAAVSEIHWHVLMDCLIGVVLLTAAILFHQNLSNQFVFLQSNPILAVIDLQSCGYTSDVRHFLVRKICFSVCCRHKFTAAHSVNVLQA